MLSAKVCKTSGLKFDVMSVTILPDSLCNLSRVSKFQLLNSLRKIAKKSKKGTKNCILFIYLTKNAKLSTLHLLLFL